MNDYCSWYGYDDGADDDGDNDDDEKCDGCYYCKCWDAVSAVIVWNFSKEFDNNCLGQVMMTLNDPVLHK